MKKKWNIKCNESVKVKIEKPDELIALLLQNRGIEEKEQVENFLHPKLEDVTLESVGIDTRQVKKTLDRLQIAYDKKEQVIIFGDYDVDGITGTAILWETLHALGFVVTPYIPHRVDEGYGLSIKGIENCKLKIENLSLIITVDNGIVATEAVDFANSLGIDVIITDHHVSEEEYKKPKAYAIVHTTKLCGAGIAYLLAKEIRQLFPSPQPSPTRGEGVPSPLMGEGLCGTQRDEGESHLELAALGTIADLVPLTGANRTIVTFGLEKLKHTKRIGLLALLKEAGIASESVGTYEVGFMIAPRLNAAGRIESAMDSLRLLCTKNKERALGLAFQLGQINRERQEIMKSAAEDAVKKIKNKNEKIKMKNILFIGDASYNPGVIGLVAGKLVEQFYRPAIVLSIGETHAKASVRSVRGVNIIEFLRSIPDMYVNIGGHAMAAGFTVEIEKMEVLQQKIEMLAATHITDDLLQRTLSVDCELDISAITKELFSAIQQLAPFGMGNPEPVFMTRGVVVEDIRTMGREGKHIKLKVKSEKFNVEEGDADKVIEAVGFGMADEVTDVQIGDTVDIAYTLIENTWNGNTKLELRLKDIQTY